MGHAIVKWKNDLFGCLTIITKLKDARSVQIKHRFPIIISIQNNVANIIICNVQYRKVQSLTHNSKFRYLKLKDLQTTHDDDDSSDYTAGRIDLEVDVLRHS